MNIVFYSYVIGITYKYGVQTSISESYYKLPRNLQWLFTIATWSYAIPAIIIGVPYSGLAFLAGAGIMFVGASPAFHDDGPSGTNQEHLVHMIGAIIGITAAQVFICFILGQWWNTLSFVGLSGLTFLIPSMNKNVTWWVEIYAFISMTIAYSLLLF